MLELAAPEKNRLQNKGSSLCQEDGQGASCIYHKMPG